MLAALVMAASLSATCVPPPNPDTPQARVEIYYAGGCIDMSKLPPVPRKCHPVPVPDTIEARLSIYGVGGCIESRWMDEWRYRPVWWDEMTPEQKHRLETKIQQALDKGVRDAKPTRSNGPIPTRLPFGLLTRLAG